ncbi:MAG: nucleoside triphosphate pyrophosphohydrolase [Spirochaetales bacterium]|nr:nucleoside triphosphate pyrophosphohydrolase [Spirochaetales bacterium]
MPDPTPPADAPQEPAGAFAELYSIVKALRAPGGCPWDREQTPYSLRTNLIEEAYEAVSAIEEADDPNLEEELGDLYLLVTMIGYMKEQEGRFAVADSLHHICAKLIRRHPHVFGDSVKETADEVIEQWDHIKDHVEGKKPKKSALERVPRSLPPLERAFEIQNKASKVGFDWKNPGPVWEKLEEEIAELRQADLAADPEAVEEEFGDLLFTVVNLGRLMGIDPTLALNRTNQKFIARFQEMERRLIERGFQIGKADLDTMDRVWNEIKAEAGRTD